MRKEKTIVLCAFLITQVLSGCKHDFNNRISPLFELLPSSTTGVTFNNRITTSDSIHILSYEYLYNGGGVGIGDFNNDNLPDIFFSGNMVPSQLYINRGDFAFEDITKQSKINTSGVWAYGVSVVDINQDGWQDIYVCAGGMGNKDGFPNKLYINNGNLTFEESAKQYGLADAGESIQAVFFDYDRDGDLDVYLLTGGGFEKSAITPRPVLTNGTGRNTDRLFRNDFDPARGHAFFTDVSGEAGIRVEGFGLGVSVLDVNQDNWPDIYVTNDYLSKDHLYVNNQNGTFSDEIDNYLKHTSYFAMGNDVGDINNDGMPDIVALDMLPEDNYRRKLMFGPNQYDKFYLAVKQGYGYQYMRNTLQVNNGNGSFSEIGQFAGIDKTDWSWAPLIADFDNDGYQDILISNGYGKDVTDLDFVKFRQSIAGLSDAKRRQALLDSLKVRPGIVLPNYAYRNNGNNTFTRVSKEWGFDTPSISNGMAYADLDLDGDLDLVVNNIDQKAFVYKNTLNEKKTNVNFVRIKLIGPKNDRDGLGALVRIAGPTFRQVRYLNPVRGFESTVENVLHFGLGNNLKVDTITVVWNDGKTTIEVGPGVNQVVTLSYENSKRIVEPAMNEPTTLLYPVNDMKFKHSENDFDDFLYQPLLPHKLSQEGPGVSVGDVNNDGLEDLYIGGSYRSPAHMIIQTAKGKFVTKEFDDGLESEDMGALFFDADNDGDDDMYVVSGGVEYYEGHSYYQDRLYINSGDGKLTRDPDALPKMRTSGSCVVAGDFDLDGDLDLFVGGRLVPNRYPESPNSYLLLNDHGKFSDVTDIRASELRRVGMVTCALWTDFDNDNDLDLIVAGEAMPIRIFENSQGRFKEVTAEAGLANSDGFWSGLVAGDFDNDGDMDYLAGNLGLNCPMHASIDKPITIHYADYDGNGSVEPLIGYFEGTVSYPVASLDILTTQLPFLKKDILYHRVYASTSMNDLLALTRCKNYQTLYCKILESVFIRNNGNGKFIVTPLPQEAQMAPVYGLIAEDLNADGNLDFLGVGNSYSPEIVYGRYDALRGVTFIGDGTGNFQFVNTAKSGFYVDGDAKGIARIETPDGSRLIVTQNSDSLRSFRIKEQTTLSRIKVSQDEQYAFLYLEGHRKRKVELNYGTTYLSQSSRAILINVQVDSVEVYTGKGNLSRRLVTRKSAQL